MLATVIGQTIKRNSGFEFNSIENSYAYQELQNLQFKNLSKKLKLSDIFNKVEPEIRNVQNDVGSVYSIIQHDIDAELNQIDVVELQLKKSLKKINYSHSSSTESRSKSQTNTGNNNPQTKPNIFIKNVDNLEKSINGLKIKVDKVMTNLIEIDSQFPTKYQSLTEEIINKQHYPLLFELIQNKHPEASKDRVTNTKSNHDKESILNEIKIESENAYIIPDQMINIKCLNVVAGKYEEIDKNQELYKIEEKIENLTKIPTIHQKMNTNKALSNKSFMLPKLVQPSKPSTSITFETIENRNF